MSDARSVKGRTRNEGRPEVDEVTPRIRELLERFSPEQIETGIVQRREHGDTGGEATLYDQERLEGELRSALLERSLGRLLRSARAASGLSLAEVGECLGVSRGRVHQVEQEGVNIEIGTLRRVADALGYDVQVTLVPRDRERTPLVAPLGEGRP